MWIEGEKQMSNALCSRSLKEDKDMEPSIIKYWKNNGWRTAKKNGKIRIFQTEGEIADWYRRNRNRIDGLSIVLPLKDKEQQSLEDK